MSPLRYLVVPITKADERLLGKVKREAEYDDEDVATLVNKGKVLSLPDPEVGS